MKNIIVCLLVLLSLSSCNKYYYLATTEMDIDLFPEAKYTYRQLTIPKGSTIVMEKKSKNFKYRKVKYNEYEGFIYNMILVHELKQKGDYHKTNAHLYYAKNPKPTNVYDPANSSSSGYNGSGGGRVNVKGYARKNGTYVSPHTRSAPRRH